MSEEMKYTTIGFVEFIGDLAFEYLGSESGVGYWKSEDEVVSTTSKLYEDYIDMQIAVREQNEEQIKRSKLDGLLRDYVRLPKN